VKFESISIGLNSLLFQNNFFDKLIYFLADPFAIIILIILFSYFLFAKNKKNSFINVFLTVLILWILSEVLKFIFPTGRPFIALQEIKPLFLFRGNDSFPSGHSIIFSGIAVIMYLENKKNGILFIISALLIGFARIVAGVHFFEDVIAGFAIGAIGAIFLLKYLKKTKKLQNNK